MVEYRDDFEATRRAIGYTFGVDVFTSENTGKGEALLDIVDILNIEIYISSCVYL